ncbi:MAG: hypothetical protein ACTSX1_09165 [Candidatus Heimdallarchaeaceae archaeon]
MTYKDNFVVEVKCNGKIMRVKDGAVYLPYGSEYTLLIKNLNSRKASVKIHIDGQDVLDYSSLILEPNSSTELEGFLRGSVANNRFKYIHKTKEIQEHRGDRVDDGLIRVEFAFEKVRPDVIKKQIITEHHDVYHHSYPPFHWNHNDWFSGDSAIKYGVCDNFTMTNSAGDNLKGVTAENCASRGIETAESINFVQQDSLGVESLGQPLDDEGITVKGSECHQSFRYGSIGELEQSQVITIQLKGMSGGGAKVQQPVTVQTKLQCSTCGTKSKSSSKYCSNCGTYLE